MNNNSDCFIFRLPDEIVVKICKYLRPNDVCQLDETCVKIQNIMNLDRVMWKKQIKSFPVAGIPFGDSTKPAWKAYRERDEDYFNKRFLNLLTDWPEQEGRRDFHEWGDGVNAYRIALKTKFTLDKMLGEIKDYFANEFKDNVIRWKEEATKNPDSSPEIYHLKSFQAKVDQVIHKEDTLRMCEWYLKKWMNFGKLYPNRRIDFKNFRMVSREGNVFKFEPVLFYGNLMEIENDSSESSDTENDSNDDDNESDAGENDSNDDDESHAGEDGEDDSDNDKEEDADDDSDAGSDNDNDEEEEADEDSDAGEDV